MDAPHALFQAVRVPGDVIINHQVAELKVDTFTGCFGSKADLGCFVKPLAASRRNTAFIPPCISQVEYPHCCKWWRRYSSVSRCSVKIKSLPRPSVNSRNCT